MAKCLYSSARKWSKYLPGLSQRYISCKIDEKLAQAPLCKGRKIPKPERKCQPKEGSCFAVMGDCPQRNFLPECYEADIKPPAGLSCCTDDRLTENPCSRRTKKPPTKEEKKPFVSMWKTFGIETKCTDAVERLDETRYKSTDNTKRIYRQTWKSCDPMIRKRKICCINEMCMLPPINKRPKTACPATAKEQDAEQLREDYNILKKCLQATITQNLKKKGKGKGKCQKIIMPCCRKAAKTIKCLKHKRKSQCLKECCPHPSFSECDQPELKKGLEKECRCLHFVNQCDADQFLARKQYFNLPPSLPAWPPKDRPK